MNDGPKMVVMTNVVDYNNDDRDDFNDDDDDDFIPDEVCRLRHPPGTGA